VPKEVIGKLAAAQLSTIPSLRNVWPVSELERNPTWFDRLVKAEIARWSPILKAASVSSN
jgi:hypothetical protein